MDLGFFRRAQSRFASRSAACLDYGVLVATLAAMQSASATARTARAAGPAEEPQKPGGDALAELLLGGPGWREAVIRQRGSFNPAQAANRFNTA